MRVLPDSDIERDSRGILDPGLMRTRVDFRRFPATGALGDVVEWFWAVRWDLPDGVEHVQPVLAHPTANLSIGPVATRGIDHDRIEATAVGVHTGIDERRLRGQGWNVAAKLRPGAFGMLLDRPASELTNQVVAIDAVVEVDSGQLVARMIEAAEDVDTQVAQLADVVGQVVAGVPRERTAAARDAVAIGSLIEHDRSIGSVRALAACTGFGVRTLQRLCREYAGVSPLWMIRRYRLIDAAEAARAGSPPSWSGLAAQLGYADQAHLTRDFKATVGMTPARYAASVQPMSPSAGADH